MPYALRLFNCLDCGKPTKRRRASNAVVRCPECAIAHSVDVQRQLHFHEGIYYERWLWAWMAGTTQALSKEQRSRISRAA